MILKCITQIRNFAVPSLLALSEEGHDIVGVVTQPDRPAGRGRMTVLPVWKGGAQYFVHLQTVVGTSRTVSKRAALAAVLWNVYEFTI